MQALVSVYGYWQVIRLEKNSPIDIIPEDEAHLLVERDLAVYLDHKTAIRLLKAKRKYDLRGQSCSIRPWMIEAAAHGDEACKAIIDGREWLPIVNAIVGDKRIVPSAYGVVGKTGLDAAEFHVSNAEMQMIAAASDAGWETRIA